MIPKQLIAECAHRPLIAIGEQDPDSFLQRFRRGEERTERRRERSSRVERRQESERPKQHQLKRREEQRLNAVDAACSLVTTLKVFPRQCEDCRVRFRVMEETKKEFRAPARDGELPDIPAERRKR